MDFDFTLCSLPFTVAVSRLDKQRVVARRQIAVVYRMLRLGDVVPVAVKALQPIAETSLVLPVVVKGREIKGKGAPVRLYLQLLQVIQWTYQDIILVLYACKHNTRLLLGVCMNIGTEREQAF